MGEAQTADDIAFAEAVFVIGIYAPRPDDLLEFRSAGVDLRRIALTIGDVSAGDLPSFPADTKRKDPRHKWFSDQYGGQCWELDAMPANLLRARIRKEIADIIDVDEWERCKHIEKAERESIKKVWAGVFSDRYENTDLGGAP